MRAAGLGPARARPGRCSCSPGSPFLALDEPLGLFSCRPPTASSRILQFRDPQPLSSRPWLQEGRIHHDLGTSLTNLYRRAAISAGEVIGLLIKRRPRPAAAGDDPRRAGAPSPNSAEGSRIIMVNGSRQRFDRQTGKLSVLTFERYTLDSGNDARCFRWFRFSRWTGTLSRRAVLGPAAESGSVRPATSFLP